MFMAKSATNVVMAHRGGAGVARDDDPISSSMCTTSCLLGARTPYHARAAPTAQAG